MSARAIFATPLLLFHSFRHLGMVFLVPTVVGPGLPPAFAVPAAYGDLLAALLALPLGPSLALLAPLGVALNGTSSVLYGTVADLVTSDRRARSYGIFYTLGVGASALAPFAYGLVSDWGGVPMALAIVGSLVFLTLPLTLLLRRPLAAAPPSARGKAPRRARSPVPGRAP